MSLPPPGWYPDPLDRMAERWWDGQGWTDQQRGPAGTSVADANDPGRTFGPAPVSGPPRHAGQPVDMAGWPLPAGAPVHSARAGWSPHWWVLAGGVLLLAVIGGVVALTAAGGAGGRQTAAPQPQDSPGVPAGSDSSPLPEDPVDRPVDPPPDVDTAFVIDAFEREVVIDADGTTTVLEVIDVVFSESRRGIFRDLPEEERFPAGSYTVIGVDQGDGGEPWDFTTERADNGDFRIRIGRADTWLSPGPYRYRMRYEAPTWSHVRAGEPDLVETRIDVPGFGWPTSIASTNFTVRAPGPISGVECVEGRLGTTEPCTTTPTVEGDTLRAELGPLSHGESATIVFTIPTDAFNVSLPVYDPTPLR